MNQIDIYKAIKEIESLISEAPLSELQRDRHKINVSALKQVVKEWEEHRAKENK